MGTFVQIFYTYLKSKLNLYFTFDFDNKQIMNLYMDSLEIQ